MQILLETAAIRSAILAISRSDSSATRSGDLRLQSRATMSMMFTKKFVLINRSLNFSMLPPASFRLDAFLDAVAGNLPAARCSEIIIREFAERLQARLAGGFFDGGTCRDEFADIVGGVLELRATGEVVISISKHNYWPITDEPSGQPLVATAALIG